MRPRNLRKILYLFLLLIPLSARAATLSVTIMSTPPGATIFIDGKEKGVRGKSSEHLKLHLPQGPHSLRLELDGYKPLEQTIHLTKEHERLAFTLERSASHLVVKAPGDDAKGGELFIDSAATGMVPGELDLNEGPHVVEVRKPGFRTFRETVNTKSGEITNLVVALQAETTHGSLRVASPAGRIFIDGRDRGSSPVMADDLDQGEYLVEVRGQEGEELWKQKVQVNAGKQTRVLAEVTAQPNIGSNADAVLLRHQYAELKKELDSLKLQVGTVGNQQEPQPTLPSSMVPTADMPGSGMPNTPPKENVTAATMLEALAKIQINGSTTLRYDWTKVEDQTGSLQDSGLLWNALRTRVRLGATYTEGPITIGLRLTAGQTPNPTVSIVQLGDAFRPKSLGFDQFYTSIRPLADRERIGLTIGKMPQPVWRGDRGTIRDELLFDDDINPEGISLHVTFFHSHEEKPSVKLENTLAYFTINDIQPFRFVGLTGTTYMIAEQLHFASPFVSAALGFYDFENINAGLRAASKFDGSAFPATNQNAFLLSPGLNLTNRTINAGGTGVGPGAPQGAASAFVSDAFRVGNILVQLAYAFKSMASLGQPEIFVMGNYTRNFGVSGENNGWGITGGIRLGDWKDAKLHPTNLWFTWRDVDRDATLAFLADSDLCSGTGCKGLEFGLNHRIYKNLMAQISYFDYQASLNSGNLQSGTKDSRVQRLFVDLIADF